MLGVGHDASDLNSVRHGAGIPARFGSAARKPLVLGFGNILLGDDGAGVRLVAQLRIELGDDAAQFIDGGTMSFSLLNHVEAADSMLIADAAHVNGAPGTITVLEGAAMDEFLKSTRRRTVHEVGLIDLLDMARLYGCLPERRALLCIQPLCIDWSEMLSAPVSEALREAADEARAMLHRWRTS